MRKATASGPANAPAWICWSSSAMICRWMEIWSCRSASRCRAAEKSSRLERTPARTCQAVAAMFRRADSERCSRLGDAMAPLAGRFQGHVQTDGGKPGAESGGGVDVAEIEAGGHAHGRIGPSAGGLDGGLGHVPLRARDLQIRMIIEGGEGEHFKIPGARRPGRGLAVEILFQETSQARIVQAAAFQGGGGLRRAKAALARSERSRRPVRAGQQGQTESRCRSQQLQQFRAFASRTPAL